ncbi:hypothetical protein [Candidatus Endolissoclinum faulkneri]|nr:hypothetical protein [Candidatus Endolissoclinum faulkneri]
MLLVNCFSVSSIINPVIWYKYITETTSIKVESNVFWEKCKQITKQITFFTEELLTNDKSFPNLASVPGRPKYLTNKTERIAIQQKLAAERSSAEYIKEKIQKLAPES